MEIHFLGCLKHLKDTLLGERRGKDNGEVGKWCHTIAYSVGKGVDDFLRLILYKIPFIYYHHKTLIVLLDKLEYIHVLRFYTSSGIQHQYAYITILNSTDGAHDTVELQIFSHLVLPTDTGCIDKIEIKAKLVVSCINTIAGRTCYLCHYVTVFSDKGIDNTALACIRATNNSKTGNTIFKDVRCVGFQLLKYKVKQVTCSASCCCRHTIRIAQS